MTIDKTDPQWLRKYCFAEIAKLPKPPFVFQKVSPVRGTLTDFYIRQRLDPNKKREACTVWYSFDKAQAYFMLS